MQRQFAWIHRGHGAGVVLNHLPPHHPTVTLNSGFDAVVVFMVKRQRIDANAAMGMTADIALLFPIEVVTL